jgi:hypothetical protein
MDVWVIGWSGIVQIAAFAGASFYSLGPGLGKRGRRGIFGRKTGWGRGRLPASMDVRLAVRAPAFEHGRLAVAILACVETFATGRARCRRAAAIRAARTTFDFVPLRAPRLLSLVAGPCRHDRRNLPMPIGHAMLTA